MITVHEALPQPSAPQPGRPFPPTPMLPPRPTYAYCPTCRGRVAGLLAGCVRPLCRTADLDYDAALNRRDDI